MSKVYLDCFDDWEDLKSQFNYTYYGDTNDDPKAPEEEPEAIIAAYSYECYEGYCEVLFWQDGELFSVTGSHCSCYGLEGQWEPMEITPEVAVKMIKEASYGPIDGHRTVFENWLVQYL